MDSTLFLIAALVGYLAGSPSFARIVTRLRGAGVDLTTLKVQLKDSAQAEDVGIVGANAASMVLGPRWGLTVALLDMLKVVIPMLVFRSLYPADYYHLAASVGGLIGHNWPVYYRFKGGRGFAVIFGSFILLDWIGALLSTLGGLAFGMMILGNTDAKARVFCGDGTGMFQLRELSSGIDNHESRVADIDGDGDLDAFLSSFDNISNEIWINTFNGNK